MDGLKEALNNPSFRRMPESMPLDFWIPAFAEMTTEESFRASLKTNVQAVDGYSSANLGRPEDIAELYPTAAYHLARRVKK